VTAQPTAVLFVDANFGGSLGQKTGRFTFPKGTIEMGVRTGPLVENGFSSLINTLLELVADGESGRRGISVDAGGGQHFLEIDLEGIGEADGQWGYTDDPDTLNEATATGGDRVQKAQVLTNYLRKGAPDSFTPARVRYGEFSPDGVMPEDELNVYVEDPNTLIDRETSSIYSSSMTLIETVDLTDPITERNRSK